MNGTDCYADGGLNLSRGWRCSLDSAKPYLPWVWDFARACLIYVGSALLVWWLAPPPPHALAHLANGVPGAADQQVVGSRLATCITQLSFIVPGGFLAQVYSLPVHKWGLTNTNCSREDRAKWWSEFDFAKKSACCIKICLNSIHVIVWDKWQFSPGRARSFLPWLFPALWRDMTE